jgi:hypothetical protein
MAEKRFEVLAALVLLVFRYSKVTAGAPVNSDSKSSAFYYLMNYGYIHKSENQESILQISISA